MTSLVFSQVREDCNIELNLLQRHASDQLKVLCVTSGGCTALSILVQQFQKLNELVCVDTNPVQNSFVCLKLALLLHFKRDRVKLFQFLEGTHSQSHFYRETLEALFKSHLLTEDDYKLWSRPDFFERYVLKGVNQSGTFEQLFQELMTSGERFDEVFSKSNLRKHFGSEAIDYSQGDFNSHFYKVIKYRYPFYWKHPEDNYFWYQIKHNRYNQKNVPFYLSQPFEASLEHVSQDHIQLSTTHTVTMRIHDTSLVKHLATSKSNTYHLIQASNVTDWLNDTDRKSLVLLVSRALRLDGFAVFRRLNGDYSLKKLLKKFFPYIRAEKDKSCFYNEVYVCSKSFLSKI